MSFILFSLFALIADVHRRSVFDFFSDLRRPKNVSLFLDHYIFPLGLWNSWLESKNFIQEFFIEVWVVVSRIFNKIRRLSIFVCFISIFDCKFVWNFSRKTEKLIKISFEIPFKSHDSVWIQGVQVKLFGFLFRWSMTP